MAAALPGRAAAERLWLGERHRRLLAVLEEVLLDPGQLVILTGDVGVGKTILAKALAARLSTRVTMVWLPYPWLDAADLFRTIGAALDFDVPDGTRPSFLAGWRRVSATTDSVRRHAVIVADEAQHLSHAVVRELAELLRLAPAPGAPRLSVLLVGQESLHGRLVQWEVESLASRIERLPALDDAETEEFLRYGLTHAGIDPQRLTAEAVRAIASLSGGVPRVIDTLRGLTFARAPGAGPIDASWVREAARRFSDVCPPSNPPTESSGTRSDGRQEERAASSVTSARATAISRRAGRGRYGPVALGLVAATALGAYLIFLYGGQRPPVAPSVSTTAVPANASPSAAAAPSEQAMTWAPPTPDGLEVSPRTSGPDDAARAAPAPGATLRQQRPDVIEDAPTPAKPPPRSQTVRGARAARATSETPPRPLEVKPESPEPPQLPPRPRVGERQAAPVAPGEDSPRPADAPGGPSPPAPAPRPRAIDGAPAAPSPVAAPDPTAIIDWVLRRAASPPAQQ